MSRYSWNGPGDPVKEHLAIGRGERSSVEPGNLVGHRGIGLATVQDAAVPRGAAVKTRRSLT